LPFHGGDVFERYTEKARRIVFFARYEAGELGALAIEPEHILLGIAREDPRLVSSVFGFGFESIENLRSKLQRDKRLSASVVIPLSTRARRVLGHAADQAQQLKDNHIGTEHLLLGVLTEEGTNAAELIGDLGFELETLRDALRERIRRSDAAGGIFPAGEAMRLASQIRSLAQPVLGKLSREQRKKVVDHLDALYRKLERPSDGGVDEDSDQDQSEQPN
jgi:ATP-dependent Clp protease ATP-binding subunit ClpC